VRDKYRRIMGGEKYNLLRGSGDEKVGFSDQK
jgi:hypothetical protein